MTAKSKSGKVRGVTRELAAKLPGRRARAADKEPGAWEQTAQARDERDDLIDCQRIVQGGDGRSLPLYYDDYS